MPTHATDRVLDWRSGHDPRSEEYRYSAVRPVTTVEPRPRIWKHGQILDQGTEGACVGFGWTAELLASPNPYQEASPGESQKFAQKLYQRARAFDRSNGNHWPDGASVTGGAKSTQDLGYIGEYRWAMTMGELRAAVITEGPVVVGIPWYDGMYDTRPSGLVKVSGRKVGGHCITLIGYHPGARLPGEDWNKRFELYKWVNSWGEEYGIDGAGAIRAEDLAYLLRQQGEACVPMRRRAIGKLEA
jgi:hypothetical protein